MRIPRPRFSIRTVLLSTTAMALILCFLVNPLYRFFEERRGSQRLLQSGAKLEYSIYLQRDYAVEPAKPLAAPATAELPEWMVDLAGDTAKLRPDADVLEVYTHNDEQVEAFCDHGHRFRQVQVIDLWDRRISPTQVLRFRDALPQWPAAIDFHFHCSLPPTFLSSLGQARTMFLWSPGLNAVRLDGVQLQEIATLANLELLWIKRYELDVNDVLHLAGCQSLRRLYLQETGLSTADFARLRSAMPQCEIADKHDVKTTPKPPAATGWGAFSNTGLPAGWRASRLATPASPQGSK